MDCAIDQYFLSVPAKHPVVYLSLAKQMIIFIVCRYMGRGPKILVFENSNSLLPQQISLSSSSYFSRLSSIVKGLVIFHLILFVCLVFVKMIRSSTILKNIGVFHNTSSWVKITLLRNISFLGCLKAT